MELRDVVSTRLTKSERAIVARAARESGNPMSVYIRNTLLSVSTRYVEGPAVIVRGADGHRERVKLNGRTGRNARCQAS